MLKVAKYAVYSMILTVPSLSAYAFVPSFRLSHSYVTESAMLFLFFLALFSTVILLAMKLNRIREENIPEMKNKMCDMAYNQRVYNCNVYSGSFELIAEKTPEEVWENYREVWRKRPQIFNERTALVMQQLEEKFG